MTIELWEKVQKPLQNVSAAQHNGNYLVFPVSRELGIGSDVKLENK